MTSFWSDPIFWSYVIIVAAVPILSTIFSTLNSRGEGGWYNSWYQKLPKSNINPPRGLFPVVWFALYVILIIAGYIGDINASSEDLVLIRWVFGLNLLLNFMWSVMFFGMRVIFPAIVINLFMIGTTIWLMFLYARNSIVSTWLLVPYLIWILVALYLSIVMYGKMSYEPVCDSHMEKQREIV